MSHKDKRLYNYVVNTLGVSKQMVMDFVNQRLEELIAKALEGKLESNAIQTMILNRITQMVRDGMTSPSRGFYERDAFEAYVKQQVHLVVEKIMREEYEIEVHAITKRPKGSPRGAFLTRPEEK